MTLKDHISISAWFMATMAGLVLGFCGTSLTVQLTGILIAASATAVFTVSGAAATIQRRLRDDT